MLTKKNLLERATGIGASEIAAVTGLSPWASPLDIYERKVAPVAVAETEDMERGNRLEAALLDWTAARCDLIVRPNEELVRHPEHPFVIATPDGYGHERGDVLRAVAVVEVKSPGRTQADWTDPDDDPCGFPDYYAAQVQWQLLAAQLPRAVLAALVWGRLWIYEVRAHPGLQAALLDAGREFWQRVEAREPPAPTTGSDVSAMARLFRQQGQDLIVPEDAGAVRVLVDEFRAAKAEEEAAGERKDLAKATICGIIGPAAGLDLGGGLRVTWKQARDTMITDWQKIARAAGATELQIAAQTVARPGTRRFLALDSKARARKEK